MIRRTNIRAQWSLTLLLAASTPVRADNVALVRDGQPMAVIVTAEDPTPAARLAARELQYHVEEITGAVLPIRGPDDRSEGVRILVGESEATRALDLTGQHFASQEYLIRVAGNTMVLMGRDWIDTPSNRREIGRGMQYALADTRDTIQYNVAVNRNDGAADSIELPGLMDEQGTCYATYDFLERFCGVRWYGPSPLNIVMPSQTTLTVPEMEIRRKPSLLHRYAPGGGWPILREQWSSHHGSQKDLFLRRIRYGGERWACNHAFSSYRDRFLVKNPDQPELFEQSCPDFFAVGWENEGFWRQLCMTNPDVIAQVVQDTRDYFDGKRIVGRQLAIGDYFAVVPEDSDHWCKCERCQAILKKSESRRIPGEFGTGLASDYVFGFVNAVAKEVKKTHPDKCIATLAYAAYFYPPTFELESNVAVAPCLGLCYAYQKSFANEEAIYNEWIAEQSRSGRRLHVWNYFHHPMERALIGGWKCFPCFMPDVISRWVKRYANDGVRGYYLCGVPQQLGYYLYMRTAFDAQTDAPQLIDEFFARYFGNAGPAMQAFYERISEINRTEGVLAWSEEASWDRLGTAERMDELGRLMEQAVVSARTDVEKRRVETWKKGIWDYMSQGRREYVKKKRSRERKEYAIGVFGTGVDDHRKLLADGMVDPHWRLVESGDATWRGPKTFVVPANAEPVPPWPERTPDAKSKWITPNNGGVAVAGGDYVYEQAFALSAQIDLETASLFGRLTGDDQIKRIEINGVPVETNASFVEWAEFVVTDHFIVGENRLRVVANNAGDAPNPHGIRVELTGYADRKTTRIPVLYSTDLHHPHMDPDDHFDLATLFSLPELEVRGIVLDCGSHQLRAQGSIPIRQMLHLTGQKVPYAIGLGHALHSPDDDGRDQPDKFQRGVQLILDVLSNSSEPVTVFTTGSLRDVAAAFNRKPDLLRRKIARLYINIGNPAAGPDSRQWEYNVKLDENAYYCMMGSGLPIYWCPCFDGGIWQRGRHGTYWKFVHVQALETAPLQVQNWFLYALTKPEGVDPIEFLTMRQDPDARAQVWKMSRNMWCTGPLLHAAGRRIYRRCNGDHVALLPRIAKQQGLAGTAVDVFSFTPVRLAPTRGEDGTVHVTMEVKPQQSNAFVFERNSDDFDKIMTACLRNVLLDLGR